MDEEQQDLNEEIVLMKLMGLPTEFTSEKIKRKNKRKKTNIRKYWLQRYRLFSLFDQGIQLDEESWYSVTPEKIAQHIASRCISQDTCIVLDAFCGAGGSAIQFALASPGIHVICIDIDPGKVRLAMANAKVYKVEHKIDFIIGDFLTIAKSGLKADVVFLSPPWGGPQYLQQDKYYLENMTPNGHLVFEMAKKISPNIAFYVPRTTDTDELTRLAGVGGFVDIESNCINEKCKAKTAYYGNLVGKLPN